MKLLQIFSVALMLLLCALAAQAAPVRVYVADMNAIGVQNRDEMKATLQVLLSSRLNGDKVTAVASAAEADAIVTGTYVVIGKIFSVDALAKTTGGKSLTRAFVQGESQDELIPAVGKLADKLATELAKLYPSGANSVGTAAAPATVSPLIANREFVKKEEVVRAVPASEFIRPSDYERSSSGGWQSKRLNGAANLMAIGRNLPDGSREIFLAENHRISFYRQGSEMKLVAETELKPNETIVSLDTLDTADGGLDIYASIVRSAELASQVWQLKGDKLVLAAEKLQYFFRSFHLAGGAKKLYAQSMGTDADFYGPVYEASRTGAAVTLKNPIKMPRFGDIYSFNQFRDRDGNVLTVTFNPDNYLVVYDQELNELWRSNDKFGGSELFFQKDDANPQVTSNKYRSIFMNQKVVVTSKGEVLVGKNDGFWVLGDARSYKKGAVYNMVWNGSSLEEKWHTRDTQNYMPDYYYDETRNELLQLQTVQRPGALGGRGASSLSIKKVE